MRKFLSILMIFAFTAGVANAQFTVMLVDDDANGDDNSASLVTAMDNWGGTYTFTNIQDDGVPTYDDMSSYDMVIWTCGNDGLDLNLWDVSDTAGIGYTAMKYNADLIQFTDAGGVLWVDAIDGMYDLCGGAPDAFSAGDFVYDKLGIAEYTSQSKADDGDLGVSEAVISASNTATTVTPLSWEWATCYFADGFTLTDDATSLYEMGGDAGYPLLGQSMMMFKNNYIYSGMRVQRFETQDMINSLVSEMITAAEGGSFPAAVSVNELSKLNINIYPNPATESAIINISEINNATDIAVYDITGRMVFSQAITGQNQVTVNTSDLALGLYNVIIASGNETYTTKLSVVK